MKYFRFFFLIVTASIFLSSFSAGQDKGFGLGIIVGEPTGISVKSWLSENSAVDGALAWSFYRGSSIHIHGDYIVHSFTAFNTEEPLALYYGIGGRLKDGDRIATQFGIRGVIGVNYLTRSVPIDVFLEIAPILDLAPATDLLFNAGLGARFFFE
ncbi:MAG: hypothetical protein EPO24_14815 [Bacteroidetes bacterium]|nr:MAG: hypothetical protein EPO24_14815 [Bacteroidota bacterium]